MMKFLLIIFSLLTIFLSSASGMELEIGGEFGISLVSFKSLPKDALAKKYHTKADGLLSPRGLIGFKYKNSHLLIRGELDFVRLVQEEDVKPFNTGELALASAVVEQDFDINDKLAIGIIGGYEHMHFEAYATDAPSIEYKYNQSDMLIGIKSFIFSHSYFPKDWDLGFSYEYTNFSQPLQKIIFILQNRVKDKGSGFFAFKIYSQRDIYLMFSLTMGFRGYFNII